MSFLKFTLSKFFMRIVGAVLICFAIFFGETLDDNEYPLVRIALSVFGGGLFLFFDPISEQIENYKKKKNREKIILSHLKPIQSFLGKFMEVSLDIKETCLSIEDSGIDYDKREIVYNHVVSQLDNLSGTQRDAIILTALCEEIDREPDLLTADRYKRSVATIFEKYNFLELDDDSKTILNYYTNYKNKRKLPSEIEGINYEDETDAITKKYNTTINLTLKLKLEKDQAEEFRRTLSILIRDGKLNVGQLEKSLKERINKELKNKAVDSKAFLVLANKFQHIKEVKRSLGRFPYVQYSGVKPHNLPDSMEYLHTRLIFPPVGFHNASDFLNEEIRPQIPDDSLSDGFIAIIPIEGTEVYSIPDKADEISKDYIKQGFDSISAYKTGVSLNMTELYMEAMKKEINIDEVLSDIPFNIFVPGLQDQIKNFLIDNYDNLKTKFAINRLADWANINTEDLRDYLIELDKGREKKRLRTDENWLPIASEIIEKAILHRDAVNR
ncbi:MAG: hypothetical protein C0623_13600 [Desulfuromonas sp.]|nr:MAG: hypothetical protein C0623_13600 [Desulfuromonas sp.]